MNRLKELKYFTLLMLLFTFIAAGPLSSCRDQKKKENTEQAGEHPEGEEHPAKDGEEHPKKEGEEHPAKDGEEHPKKEGEEHPKKDGEEHPAKEGEEQS
jgi:flagellar biosynthesis/type III secretory pathway M-ring protein FliF/YscJ